MSLTIDVTQDVESYARRVQTYLDKHERSLAWLARRAGVKPSTLRDQLANPSSLKLTTVLALEPVLNGRSA